MRIVIPDIPPSPAVLQAFLEAMTGFNAVLINEAGLPSVYDVARYRREPKGREEWYNAARVAAQGFGDCEDLAAYRAAELRVYDGELARVVVKKTGPKLLHAVVERADGTLEDVARALGMRGKG